jgi:hypothetical protein
MYFEAIFLGHFKHFYSLLFHRWPQKLEGRGWVSVSYKTLQLLHAKLILVFLFKKQFLLKKIAIILQWLKRHWNWLKK